MSEDQLIGEFGPSSYPVRVQLRAYKGRRFVDVRRFYDDKPTKKGIALTDKYLTGVIHILNEHIEVVCRWLNAEETDIIERVVSLDEVMRRRRQEQLETLPQATVRDEASLGAASLFSVDFAGGDVEVTLNDQHPITRQLATAVEEGDSKAASEVLVQVLHASFRAVGIRGDGGLDLEEAEAHGDVLGILLAREAQ